MKIYIAHNITAAQGGRVIGVYPTYKRAKAQLILVTGMADGCTDFGHFIRIGKLGKTFLDVLALPRSDQAELTKAMKARCRDCPMLRDDWECDESDCKCIDVRHCLEWEGEKGQI